MKTNFKRWMIIDRPHPLDPDGFQKIFEFKNGYSVSVVQFWSSYGSEEGLYEAALIKDGDLVYEYDFEEDVIGYLDEKQVNSLLHKVKNYENI